MEPILSRLRKLDQTVSFYKSKFYVKVGKNKTVYY